MLDSEKEKLNNTYSEIIGQMAALEPAIREAYTEYSTLLATSPKYEYQRRQTALDNYRQLILKRDNLMRVYEIRKSQVHVEIEHLNSPVIMEISDVLMGEVTIINDKVIFQSLKRVTYESNKAMYEMIKVRHNFDITEHARELVLSTLSTVRNMLQEPLSKVLDYLDERFDEYEKLNFSKTREEDWDEYRVREQSVSLKGEKFDPLLQQENFLKTFSDTTQRVIDSYNVQKELDDIKYELEKRGPRPKNI